jgi:hypothetical protein
VLKARDNLAPAAIEEYRRLCRFHGLYEQEEEVAKAFSEVVKWRAAHPDECKWPDHAHVPAGEPGSGSES